MIACRHLSSYEINRTEEEISRLFDMLGLEKIIQPEWKITVKPNLLMKRHPEEGTTTHPAVVRGIIRNLQKLGVKQITIADSPGGPYTKSALAGIYRASGMEEVAAETGAILNYDLGTTHCPQPDGVVCKAFDLINPIAKADFVISAAKLKSHCMTGLSGAVKNLFGCIPGLTKPEFHWRFPQEKDFCNMLLDLCETVKPGVTFVDAVVSMEGDGPSSGTLRQTGLLLASDNPYQLDLALAHIIGREPDSILTIRNAQERGLCTLNFDQLEQKGDSLPVFADFQMPRSRTVDFQSNIPKPLRGICKPLIDRFFTPKPVIDRTICIGCGKCAESCPPHTISIVNRKAEINRANCIKCYCCHEMCPVHAISVKRSRILEKL
ncbi:MAG: DUF362 domain-containing protein [Candidatus Merdivicinus sp.]